MNYDQIRLTEECLYARKYLYGRIQELALIVDAIMPKTPGSVVKMVGKPQAKTPLYTSETEQFGILRATCREAEELQAKTLLRLAIHKFKSELGPDDHEFVTLLYDKERPPARVKTELRLSHSQYYNTRLKLLRRLWRDIAPFVDTIDLAVI